MMNTTGIPQERVLGENRYLYWSYGSNLNVAQMAQRCPDAVPVMKADLPNAQLLFRGNSRGSGVATVERLQGSTVPGGLWVISKHDLVALDRYEGYPRLYTRGTVTVQGKNGQTYEALTYWMHHHYQLALPSEYYLNVIREGYRDFEMEEQPLDAFLSKHATAVREAKQRA